MTDELTPDLCVIGRGAGAQEIATGAAAFGASVVMTGFDDAASCDSAASMHRRALVLAAARVEAARRAASFGIRGCDPTLDPAALRDSLQAVTASLAPNHSVARLAALGIRVVAAPASFRDTRTVEAGGLRIRARRFVLATGSRPALPSIDGLDAVPVLTEHSIAALPQWPRRLAVIGGGTEGLELAQAYRRFGSEVVLIERGDLLAGEDPELVEAVARSLRRAGIVLHAKTRINRLEAAGGGVRLHLDGDEAGSAPVEASHVLLAAGRKGLTDDFGLAAADIVADERGILVDAGLRSSNRRVFAIGDCIAGGSHHAAAHQAERVLRNLLFRLPVRLDRRTLPRVTFTDPELACVGLTEAQARERHPDVQVLRWPFAENDRARAERSTQGHVKLVADRRGRLLGCGIVGAGAGELIAPWALALAKGLSVRDMAAFTPASPTRSEASRRAALSALLPRARSPATRRLVALLRRLG